VFKVRHKSGIRFAASGCMPWRRVSKAALYAIDKAIGKVPVHLSLWLSVTSIGKMWTCRLADQRTCNLPTKNLRTATVDQWVNCRPIQVPVCLAILYTTLDPRIRAICLGRKKNGRFSKTCKIRSTDHEFHAHIRVFTYTDKVIG